MATGGSAGEDRTVVIVGAGAAGHGCARTLRSTGFAGRILLINGEGGHPIDRTHVDTKLLFGALTAEEIALPPVPDVEIVDARAVSIDAESRTVTLDDGRDVRGDAVVLATGNAPRGLDSDVQVDPAVVLHHMHTVADAEAVQEALPDPAGKRVAVIGAGFTGTELASHYRQAGAIVSLVGRSPQPLKSGLGETVADRLGALHREHVDARFEVPLVSIEAASNGATLRLADGHSIEADIVLVAQGAAPNSELLGTRGGVPVDAWMRVERMPGVYAAGSAAVVPVHGGRAIVDHWDAAGDQGAVAAKAVVHDLFGGDEPDAYVPRTLFTLRAYGHVLVMRGVRVDGCEEELEELVDAAPGSQTIDYRHPDAGLVGVAGWNAGVTAARSARKRLA